MPWINVIPEDESEGELKEAYARMREVNQSYEAAWPNERPLDPTQRGGGWSMASG